MEYRITPMANRLLLTAATLPLGLTMCLAQQANVSGKVVSRESGKPIEFAAVLIKGSELWGMSDKDGRFVIRHAPQGKATLSIQCLGYAPQTLSIDIKPEMRPITIRMDEETLQLDEVAVVAKRDDNQATTSYSIGRQALDQQQVLTIGDIAALLPGGKTQNPTLMNDTRLRLRSESGEAGNSAFGTAVEIDGVRVGNNAAMGETNGASLRQLGSSNVEAVEVTPGIPSVEYGDLTNGIVRVRTRKGRTPFIVESKITQHTRLVSASKGIDLGANAGLLNASVEHARSFSDIASPHTAYQRNTLSLNYTKVFMPTSSPLTLTAGLTGNVGGYNSKSDPDEQLDDYSKMRNNQFNANFRLHWQPGLSWITSVDISGSASWSDNLTETYSRESSSTTQPYLHALTEGYHIAEEYDANPGAPIILGPTGYWYVKAFNDSKPLDLRLKLKATWARRFGFLSHRLGAGAEWTRTSNAGRGTYYEDMRYAPTWRERRYDQLPAMQNMGVWAEEALSASLSKASTVELTVGLRNDMTHIGGSDYGTAASLSPRVNGRYVWRNTRDGFLSEAALHAGWGKAVKLPSFQVLYPSPVYADRMAFASTSDAENRSFHAYYTIPSSARYNPNLQWQYSHQYDVGIDISTKVARLSLSGFISKTLNAYMATSIFTPFTYKYTTPSAVQNCGIPVADRAFSISSDGIITVSDKTGRLAPVTLDFQSRNTYYAARQYANASPVERWGMEWIVDFAQIKPLRTQVRVDGNYYWYRSLDGQLFADVPYGLTNRMTDGRLYQYIGYYLGTNATSTGYTATASVSNGHVSRACNLNTTITTHIPRIRMVLALRVEASLYAYSRAKCELPDGSVRGYEVLESADLFGEPYTGGEGKTVIVYPVYYSTWENPGERIPFLERFLWAKEHDQNLFNDLSRLIVRSNYPFTMNGNRVSAYYSANFSVTKEIGDHVSVSFYANNFLNTMRTVRSSQTGLETSLFGSGYVPSFYYGLSLKLKL